MVAGSGGRRIVVALVAAVPAFGYAVVAYMCAIDKYSAGPDKIFYGIPGKNVGADSPALRKHTLKMFLLFS